MDSPRKRLTHHNGGRPHLGDRVTATVRLPRNMREQLNDEADARSITLTDLINEIVARHFDSVPASSSLAQSEPKSPGQRAGYPGQQEFLVA